MIRPIDDDQLDDIDPIIDRMKEQTPLQDNFVEQIKTDARRDRVSILGYFSKDGSLLGVSFFGKISKRISFTFADGDFYIEKELVSSLFDRFKTEFSYMKTGGPWITDKMEEHLLGLGFKEFRRAYKTMPKADVETLEEPILPEGMHFEVYSPEEKDEVAELMFISNDGHVDQDVFPDFFGSKGACRRLIDNIVVNRYGEYKESSSWILRDNDKTIGACFMTIRNGEAGYIPDIVIDPDYRRRGLGKAIQVHSMKRQIESEPSIIKMDLDVTLSNNARFLYDSLGFETVSEYTLYSWREKWNH
ncbi:MAG: GNAT family N-acetyltransferase [Candidatus Thorarchaeota archaeon]|jgi:ribosomal protein S18 acetylase RimI-like enzyme